MSKLKEALFVGPTYAGLSDERRKAFVRQWAISGIIFTVCAIIAVIVLAVGSKPSIAIGVLVILLALQFVYALIRGETVWQLRIREWKYRSNVQKSNKAELLDFADQLKQGKSDGEN